MKKLCFFIVFLLSTHYSFCQNLNLIIQVNNEIVSSGIANLKLKFNQSKSYDVTYCPGDLIVNAETWLSINSDTVKQFYLTFDYYTYINDRQKIRHFEIKLNKSLLQKPYLIANIFDFRDKKFKRRYQYLTKENYLVQIGCNGCGLYIKRE